MYKLQKWEKEYQDIGEHRLVYNRLSELIGHGLYIPVRGLGHSLVRFLGSSLVWTETVGRLVDNGPKQNHLLRAGAIYEGENRPEIIDAIQSMLGEGKITEVPAESFDIVELAR